MSTTFPRLDIARVPHEAPLNARWPLYVMAAVVGLAGAVIWDARRGGSSGLPSLVEHSEIAFARTAENALSVRDGEGREIARLASADEGFVPSVLRGLNRERIKRDLPLDTPYTLSRRADGKLVIADPKVGTRMELTAFGRDNHAAFEAFMPDRRIRP
jgi:putative photosynthetic complex assembly protein